MIYNTFTSIMELFDEMGTKPQLAIREIIGGWIKQCTWNAILTHYNFMFKLKTTDSSPKNSNTSPNN
ncbi:hypothetical protein EDI28_24740 [Photobacterium chitinilyticum]|uniref:Uncharacterized protein n=1 Tax=Photobacterium chitinilyticum TaxID=2485123 RepID=A0A3S3R5M5_9GAMM|nr:hypothetical protein EDI28_24740 [Photobacterium chitinilyticum]